MNNAALLQTKQEKNFTSKFRSIKFMFNILNNSKLLKKGKVFSCTVNKLNMHTLNNTIILSEIISSQNQNNFLSA